MKKASSNTERIELSYHSQCVLHFDKRSDRVTESEAEREWANMLLVESILCVQARICWFVCRCAVFLRSFEGILPRAIQPNNQLLNSVLTSNIHRLYRRCCWFCCYFFLPSVRNINRTLRWMITWVDFFLFIKHFRFWMDAFCRELILLFKTVFSVQFFWELNCFDGWKAFLDQFILAGAVDQIRVKLKCILFHRGFCYYYYYLVQLK